MVVGGAVVVVVAAAVVVVVVVVFDIVPQLRVCAVCVWSVCRH